MIFNIVGTWEMIRAAGIVSYMLFWFGACAGILYSEKVFMKKRAMLFMLHQSSGWFAFLFALLHGGLLLIDTYMPYGFTELLIPFTAKNETTLSGFGTIAFICLFIVLISSDLMRKLSKKVWKAVHLLTIPTFIMMSIHGFFIGADSLTPPMLLVYMFTTVSFLLLIGLKGIKYGFSKSQNKVV
ncbi:ferric reductase-like transmembrane domain-containing protein [Bacillus massiliigorillae]|uniref:ferric reductase-like transmembrane domain-containing protein n=1 Tax=Bacillus massiliigorillae TaxID=1243664 RepID=UPI0003AA55AC|nr:ferric reductase-like transmembrane domain-containing protein [Bacillus massiliigorillae]